MVLSLGVGLALLGQSPSRYPSPPSGGLDAPVRVASYSIRPPKGFESLQQPGPDGSRAFAWAGSPRTDGTRSMLMLITITPKGADAKTTLDVIARKMVDGVRQRRSEWKRGPIERKRFNGLDFVRIAWSGRNADSGLDTEGVHYVLRDGAQVVVLWTQDVVPEGRAALRLAEASIRTFRKPS